MAVSTRFPTANEVETTGWTNPNNAHADEGTDATAAPGKNAVIGTRWFTFGFDGAIPTGSTIDAVKIIYEYFVDTNKSIATMRTRARISGVDEEDHDDTSEPLSATVITVDITADRAWTRADLLDAAFKVAGVAVRGNSNNAVTFDLDYIKVEVTYTAPQNQDVNVTGVAGTGAVGTVTVRTDVDVSATGVAGTGSVGTVSVRTDVDVSPTGLSATGAVGTVTVDTGQADADVTVTGVSATGSVGTVSVTTDVSISPSGLAATGSVGSVSVQGDVDVSPTGVAGTGATGSVSVTTNIDVSVSGTAGTGSVGTVSVRTDVSPAPTGLGLTGYVGTVTVSITVPSTTMGLYICGAIGIPLAATMKTNKT